MNRKLLIIGGVLNTILGLFHIVLAQTIQQSIVFSPESRPLLHAFNVFGMIVIFCFAYISFFHQRDLMSTKLGKTVLVLVFLVYFSRAIVEIFLFDFSFAIFIPCVLIAGLYIFLALRSSPVTNEY